MTWLITVGNKKVAINHSDPIEAATLAVEQIIREQHSLAVGNLIHASYKKKNVFLRSDVILANAGCHPEATLVYNEIQKLEKKKS